MNENELCGPPESAGHILFSSSTEINENKLRGKENK